MKKSERPKASEREDGVDFISSMPDAILVLILSRLSSIEEGIQSSILSRRWRYLWTAIPSVNIDTRKARTFANNKFEKSEFGEFVYWVLVNKSVDLDRVRLFCSLDYSVSTQTVERWIHVAVTRNVKQLDLTFCRKPNTEGFEIRRCLLTCVSLEVLRLSFSFCRLKLPNIVGFPALRVLHLSYVHLWEDGDLINGFFESCTLLEDLSLQGCYMQELDLLCISCPKLKKLSIETDENLLMCGGIKISCPKLVALDLTGHNIGNIFLFESLKSLKKAVIQPKLEGSNISVLFPGISSVEYLEIDLYFFCECINAASCNPSLPNLKILLLKTTMDAFTMDNFNQVLKYYPKLESLKLIINEDYDEEYEWLDEDETRLLFTDDVKRVEFFEFKGEKSKVDIYWYEYLVEVKFSWGKEVSFPYWCL